MASRLMRSFWTGFGLIGIVISLIQLSACDFNQIEKSSLKSEILEWGNASLVSSESLPDWPKNLKLAILLPLTGPQSTSVAWIAKGLEEQLESIPADRRPSYWFIDTRSESATHIQKALHQAHDKQADWIMGPLTKPGVQFALQAHEQMTPLLLLNYSAHPLMYQFSLAPEDELEQMTHLLDREHAYILAPSHTHGRREAEALSRFWVAQNHSPASVFYYTSDPEHMTRTVRQLLGQTHSSSDHHPSALPPSSVIFLLGKRSDALLIKPLLNFYGASDIPVIGTSSLAPHHAAEITEDFNGILYCDMPPASPAEGHTQSDLAYKLQAFGHDAWLIARLLFGQSSSEKNNLPAIKGKTGLLKLNPLNHHMERHLVCRQFRNGRPHLLENPSS